MAGVAAGAVNVIVGGGSLITFPTLLALGYAPVLANVSNNVGLTPGNLSGVFAYREELVGQRPRLVRLASASLLGGLTGAVLLLALPGKVFSAAVPLLIALGAVLMAIQPWLRRWIDGHRSETAHGGVALWAGIFVAGIYGGYFGAAQGVLLMALMAVFLDDSLQRLNGVKNVLALVVNLVAAIFFVAVTHVAWPVAGLVAVGTGIGGWLGGRYGRRIPDRVLRWCVVGVGLAVALALEITKR